MTDDLFPDAYAKSPRTQWLERHGLCLWKTDTRDWIVRLDEHNYYEEDDPDDAAWGFCRVTGIKHWLQ